MERTKKYLNYLFLNTTPKATPNAETWARVGKSTEWTDTMNATVETFDYIEDSSPTDELQNYKPTTSMPLTAYIGDPVYDYVFELYNKQGIGSDAITQSLRVYQNKKDGANIAQRTEVLIVIDNYNFATSVITFTMNQRGTPVLGTAVVAETPPSSNVWKPTFTPDAEGAVSPAMAPMSFAKGGSSSPAT